MNEPTGSLFAALRRLVPRRPLRWQEALRIAELQANRFRELLQIACDEMPDEAMSDLRRMHVTYETDLPVSGVAQWHNGRWIIALNALEPWTRQRFSLAHELFHVINHTTKDWLHPADRHRSAVTKAEQLADYFAGCLLMPKRLVKRYVGRGESPSQLTERFGVSARALGVRLSQLGLEQSRPRCVQPANSFRRVVPLTEQEGVAA